VRLKWTIYLLVLSSTASKAQLNDTLTLSIIESTLAKFPGGTDSLSRFIAETAVIPLEALEKSIGGEVTLMFTIDSTGHLINIELQSIKYWPHRGRFTSNRKHDKKIQRIIKDGDDFGLIDSAKDVLEKSPIWIPATSNGTPVEMRFRLPIRFHIY
jgi:hypothetical protein